MPVRFKALQALFSSHSAGMSVAVGVGAVGIDGSSGALTTTGELEGSTDGASEGATKGAADGAGPKQPP